MHQQPHVCSIFVDESGDFGPYAKHAPFYLVTFVMHDQAESLQLCIDRLHQGLSIQMLPDEMIHTAPLIRREPPYREMDLSERRRILNRGIGFLKMAPITAKTFWIEKRQCDNAQEMIAKLSKQVGAFLQVQQNDEWQKYDQFVIYYDDGQAEIKRMLTAVFASIIGNVEFRTVKPDSYKLFQAADLICTMELCEIKYQHNLWTKTDQAFFGSHSDFRRNYYKHISRLHH